MDDAIFQIGDTDNGCDELEIVYHNKGLTFTIANPWAGDTETGFGRSSSIRISLNGAKELSE